VVETSTQGQPGLPLDNDVIGDAEIDWEGLTASHIFASPGITLTADASLSSATPEIIFTDTSAEAGTVNLSFQATGSNDMTVTFEADESGSQVTYMTFDTANDEVLFGQAVDMDTHALDLSGNTTTLSTIAGTLSDGTASWNTSTQALAGFSTLAMTSTLTGATGLTLGSATTDGSSDFTIIMGAQTDDPQFVIAMSDDANGDVTMTTTNGDDADITITSTDDIMLDPGGNVINFVSTTETMSLTNGSNLWTFDSAGDTFVFNDAVDVNGAFTAGTVTSDAGVSGTTITGTGKISTTVTTEQLRLNYDADNYATWTVAADGALTVVTVDQSAAEGDINFNPDGYVGIKTATPTVELDVTGAIKASGTVSGATYGGDGS